MPAASADLPANLANWRTEPFSRWAFHHVKEIVASDDIANAPGDVSPLPAAAEGLGDFRLPAGDSAVLDLQGFLDATSTDAFIVLKDGEVVHEAYPNGNDAHTPHILMSATKSVIGLVAGILHGRGRLDVEALVSDLVPEIAGTAYAGATLRQLLDMRTGVVLDEAQQRAYDAASNWDVVAPGEAGANLHAFFQTLTSPNRGHGGPFAYVSANTDLLGWALERASGQTVASLVSELLWRPMGAEDPAYITVDRQGAARCTGGLCATVRDFARIGQLIVEGGRRGSSEIVPAAWIEDFAGQGDAAAWRDGEWGQAFAAISPHMRYRGGWYVVDEAPQLLFAMGIHGQNLFVDRANRIVIAKLSSLASRIDYRALLLTHRAVDEIRRTLVDGSRGPMRR